MALLGKSEIKHALERLGQMALEQGQPLKLMVMGGAAMVLGYDARQSTHDIDVFIQAPLPPDLVRAWAKKIALELDWPEDWINDAAKGFLVGLSSGPIVLSAPGIEVRQLAVEQLLAMKLAAWRDDVDISDATRLLREIKNSNGKEGIWKLVDPFLADGFKLKAQYALFDLWESIYGPD